MCVSNKESSASSALVLLLLGLVSGTLVAGEKVPLRVGFYLDPDRVDSTYSENDVMVATKVLFEKVLAGDGSFDPEFRIFRSETGFAKAIEADELDYVELGPLFWLRLPEEVRKKVIPVSIVQTADSRLDRFVLLAAPGETLESLAGKRVFVDASTDRGVASVWCEYELHRAGLPAGDEHFMKVESRKKSNGVLLPTFFGKADACIVKEVDYVLAAELNPQISQRLVPVKTSPGFPLLITASAGSNKEKIKAEFGGTPEDIIQQKGAKQALALLRVKTISAYEKGDMDELKAMVDVLESSAKLLAAEKSEEEK